MRVSVRERTTSGAVHERTRKTSVHRGRADDGGVRFDEALAFDVDVSDASRLSLRVELHSHRRPHALLGALHLASRVRPPAPLPPLAPNGSDQQRVGAGGGEDSKQQQQWFASSCEARAQWLDVLAQRVRSDAPRWHPVVSEPSAHRNNEGDSIWRRARNSLLRHKRAARGGGSLFDAHTQPDAGGGDSCDAGPGGGEKSEHEGDGRQGSRRGSRSLLWPFGSVRERRRRTTESKAQALLNKQMSFQ